MAAVEAASAPNAEFFFDHVSLSGSACNGPVHRADWNAGSASVALCVDIGLGTGLDGIGETV